MKKKIVKKKPAAKKKVASKSQEIVLKVQTLPALPTTDDLSNPVKDGGKYMIPQTWVSERQAIRLVQKTPPQHVYKRPGKGGQVFHYVTGNYVEKVLNFVFGWNWDFEVVSHGKEGKQVWVLGKLRVKNAKGNMEIVKSQFGRADIKVLKGTNDMLDFGNDLKAAATDSLKKCASLLGVASDIYGKTEYKQETGNDAVEAPPAAPKDPNARTIVGPEGEPVMTCSKCDGIISVQVGEYSKKIYGKTLCRECQNVTAKK